MSDSRTVKPGEMVDYHDNPDHDSLFLRFEQIDKILSSMESSQTCCTGAQSVRRILGLIRAQVLK